MHQRHTACHRPNETQESEANRYECASLKHLRHRKKMLGFLYGQVTCLLAFRRSELSVGRTLPTKLGYIRDRKGGRLLPDVHEESLCVHLVERAEELAGHVEQCELGLEAGGLPFRPLRCQHAKLRLG